jgi:hypothetical protein
MQVVRSKSGVGDTNVEALYFLAIESARATLDLTAAYFAPRRAWASVGSVNFGAPTTSRWSARSSGTTGDPVRAERALTLARREL